jgi:hypothetical protein
MFWLAWQLAGVLIVVAVIGVIGWLGWNIVTWIKMRPGSGAVLLRQIVGILGAILVFWLLRHGH